MYFSLFLGLSYKNIIIVSKAIVVILKIIKLIKNSPLPYGIFSTTLNFALLERAFSFISSFVGTIGFLETNLPRGLRPHTQIGISGGQMQPFENSINKFFTNLSSNE